MSEAEGAIFSWSVIVFCSIGIALIARYNYLANRNAGNGWYYVYWQPWRKWLVFGPIGFLVLFTAFIQFTEWLYPYSAEAIAPHLESPVLPLR